MNDATPEEIAQDLEDHERLPLDCMQLRMFIEEDGLKISSSWRFSDDLPQEDCDYFRDVLEGVMLSILSDEGQFLDVTAIARIATRLQSLKQASIMQAEEKQTPKQEFEGLADNVILFPSNNRRH